jgi:sporulation protein YlmC with PRC-barrel domain
MRIILAGALGALVLGSSMCIGLAQAETSRGTPDTSSSTPAPSQLDMKAAEPNVIRPPQSSNSAAKEDKNANTKAIFNGLALSDLYNRDVYDAQDKKIGSVKDGLFNQEGKLNSIILGVGGVLGMGEKDVGVPFNAIKIKVKDGKRYLATDMTKEALDTAPAYTYDHSSGQWVVASKT